MSTPNKVLLIAGLLMMATLAWALPAIEGISPQGLGLQSEGINSPGKPVVQPTGDILMVDGVSLILQTDAASFICLAGGC